MQIDTTQNAGTDAPAIMKERMKAKVDQFMSTRDTAKRIEKLIGKSQNRLTFTLDELRMADGDLADYVKKNPIEAIAMFENQLDGAIKDMKDEGGKQTEKQMVNQGDKAFPSKVTKYYVSFEGNFGKNHVTPRGLNAALVNQFVSVRGIVTRMDLVKPKIQTSVHYCETTKKGSVKHYSDHTNLADNAEDALGKPSEGNNTMPTTDANGNALSCEYGYCLYKDSQNVTIQEMPENAPPGQLPRSVQVILENDLVDKLKPGDRVEVNGVFRTQSTAHMGLTNGIYKTHIVATGVKSLLADKEKPSMSEQDIKNIKKLASDSDLFNIMGQSVAPSIEGSLIVKKAILLQLIGGHEKNLANGTHLRGDINVMMVGDPSTAKSQLLRHIMDIAPLAINTTGRGSSGVGLTAAVATDPDSGDRHLEAGAMVLADRGIVCIDEFDKMNDVDRVAIHEVMEQQTVTIAKAGIHCSLNARCSVIAAANPVYGEYARDIPAAKNIGLPDSLLSRFDLVFVMLDEKDPEHDRRIAEKVINNHRFMMPGGGAPAFSFTYDDTVIEPEVQAEQKQDGKGTNVYEKQMTSSTGQQLLTRDFLKKYVAFVKSQKPPELHGDCVEYAAQIYAALREKAAKADQAKVSVPITVRTLETIIRLATAHAKMRLSRWVENSDVEMAVKLLRTTIFQEDMGLGEIYPVKEEEAEMEEDEEEAIVTNQPSFGRRGKNIGQTRSQPPNENFVEPNSKKIKPDADEQVAQLMAAKPETVERVDMHQKKLIFKIATQLKDAQNKADVDAMYQRYMTMSSRETCRPGTDQPLINNKDELIEIIEALERENLLMYAAEDNMAILM